MERESIGGRRVSRGIGVDEATRMSRASRDLRLLLAEAEMEALDVERLVREFGGTTSLRPIEEYEACVRVGRMADRGETAATEAGPLGARAKDGVRAVA